MMIRHAMLSITPSFLNGDTGASLAEGGCMDATITWKRAVVTAAGHSAPPSTALLGLGLGGLRPAARRRGG